MAEGSTAALSSMISVRPFDPLSWPPATWDTFASECGASMRSAYAHLKHLQLRRLHKGWVRTYGLYLPASPGGELIGWFTIVSGLRTKWFHDGLRLRPEHEPLWLDAMCAALQCVGPGRYEYGWALSLEPCRAAALARLPEVKRLSASKVVVHAVDFARWSDWPSYFRDVSENSRRNARKALKANADLRLEIYRGLSSLWASAPLLRLRSEMYRRKRLAFRALRSMAGYAAGALFVLSRPWSRLLVRMRGRWPPIGMWSLKI